MKYKTKRYIIACDPGTGSSSPAGLAVYDSQEEIVLETAEIWSDKGFKLPTEHRIKNVVDKCVLLIQKWLIDYQYDVTVKIEWFMLRGKGGETLQRFIGGIICGIPYEIDIHQCHNITIKKQLTGQQSGDKMLIANAVLNRLPRSEAVIKDLIDQKSFDALDAIAIALCDDKR